MNRPWIEQSGNIHALPVCHNRVEFADLVRAAFEVVCPDAVAVELPGSLEPYVLRAIRRLPQVSAILFQDRTGHTVYLPVEPADPLIEGIRGALERRLPVAFVDVDVDEYPRFRDPIPDPYALLRIGPEAFYRSFVQVMAGRLSAHPLDVRRERGMAHHLQGLQEKYGRILFICGMAHLPGVLAHLKTRQPQPLERVRREAVQVFNLHPESTQEVMHEYPFLSAVYEMRRRSLPPEPEMDRYTVRKRMHVRLTPLFVIQKEKGEHDESAALRVAIEWAARRVESPGELDRPGDGGTPREEESPSGASEPGPEDEAPVGSAELPGPIDRQLLLWRLFQLASRHYEQDTGETVAPWQRRLFMKFSRNYALVDSLLIADFFHMVAAARATVDDNFCYALWRLGSYYPWQKEATDLPTLRITGDEIWLGQRRMNIRRWVPRRKQRPFAVPVRRRKSERRPGEWLEAFDSEAICSYPPEDIVVEDYGHFLQKKGRSILSEEKSRVEPFTVSMLDGIDMRETIRNWAEGKIYVREQRVVHGGMGSVVVIFDEDEDESLYPYRMTWHGEHEQESDMAFYATAPGDNIVGPGISRCEYGGFMMTYPPRRVYDVWRDPDYLIFRLKSEVLLAAALDYSVEKFVVYVAAHQPRSQMRTLAARFRRQIIYIPIGQLSPAKIKQIRVAHILSGYDKREMAKEYIW